MILSEMNCWNILTHWLYSIVPKRTHWDKLFSKKHYPVMVSMIFDAYESTSSVAILHPRELNLFPGGHVWSARRLDIRECLDTHIFSVPVIYIFYKWVKYETLKRVLLQREMSNDLWFNEFYHSKEEHFNVHKKCSYLIKIYTGCIIS